MSPTEVEERLTSTAEDVNAVTLPGKGNDVGAGRINAFAALSTPAPITLIIGYDSDIRIEKPETALF